MNLTSSAKSDLKRFLTVFLGAIGGGILLTVFMLYSYSPSGHYVVKNVLFAPATLQSMAYPERENGIKEVYIFDRITFTHYNSEKKSWGEDRVSFSQYEKFYAVISEDKSLDVVDRRLEEAFRQSSPARLSFYVHSQKRQSSKGKETELLQVQILSEGDFYRIQLRQEAGGVDWVYFNHHGIYRMAIEQFGNHS